jgi:hypothetical protein
VLQDPESKLITCICVVEKGNCIHFASWNEIFYAPDLGVVGWFCFGYS